MLKGVVLLDWFCILIVVWLSVNLGVELVMLVDLMMDKLRNLFLIDWILFSREVFLIVNIIILFWLNFRFLLCMNWICWVIMKVLISRFIVMINWLIINIFCIWFFCFIFIFCRMVLGLKWEWIMDGYELVNKLSSKLSIIRFS